MKQWCWPKRVISERSCFFDFVRSVGSTKAAAVFSCVELVSVSSCSRSRSPGAAGCAFSRSDSPDVVLSSPSPSFLFRVLRAAFFIQLLLLLLIGLACMVPMTEEDYSCHYANNFARSFHPMLRYMNGPPPVWEGAKNLSTAFPRTPLTPVNVSLTPCALNQETAIWMMFFFTITHTLNPLKPRLQNQWTFIWRPPSCFNLNMYPVF